MNLHAPGSRVVIRDEEWLVRRVDPSDDGGQLLTCDGVSDLVRGRSALFLTALEGPIAVLDPAKTQLVSDSSRTYNASLLYLESQRRRSTPTTTFIHLGHRGVMNLVPYQLDPALQALRQPRAAHSDRRRRRSGQDAGSGHPCYRAYPARPGASASCCHAEKHADPVSEGVVEPLFDSAGAA